jgi:hypothetical protein
MFRMGSEKTNEMWNADDGQWTKIGNTSLA